MGVPGYPALGLCAELESVSVLGIHIRRVGALAYALQVVYRADGEEEVEEVKVEEVIVHLRVLGLESGKSR